MPDFNFINDSRANFPTKYHGEVSISKIKWDEICQEPERFYYRENAEKIATTLINPEYVRHHNIHPSQLVYYKKFETFTLGNKQIDLRLKYWAVIIDTHTGRICTIYPVAKPKPGKEYKGGGS